MPTRAWTTRATSAGLSAGFLKLATDRGFSVKLLVEHNRPVGVLAVGHYQRFVVRRP
ncbi:MAG TPA: hypothetical protein VMP01_14780 [Pirellulaceae bacterium]|nr:hypothetical protein [Pirellulaceae bacterium]